MPGGGDTHGGGHGEAAGGREVHLKQSGQVDTYFSLANIYQYSLLIGQYLISYSPLNGQY